MPGNGGMETDSSLDFGTCWAQFGKYEVLGMSLVLEGSWTLRISLREAIPTHREVPGEARAAGNQENNQKIPGMTFIHVLDIPQKFYQFYDGHQLCIKPLWIVFPLLPFP